MGVCLCTHRPLSLRQVRLEGRRPEGTPGQTLADALTQLYLTGAWSCPGLAECQTAAICREEGRAGSLEETCMQHPPPLPQLAPSSPTKRTLGANLSS